MGDKAITVLVHTLINLINLNGRMEARNTNLALFSSKRQMKLIKITKKSSLHNVIRVRNGEKTPS